MVLGSNGSWFGWLCLLLLDDGRFESRLVDGGALLRDKEEGRRREEAVVEVVVARGCRRLCGRWVSLVEWVVVWVLVSWLFGLFRDNCREE